jgi:hypothetical protein
LIGVDTASPFAVTWSNVGPGTYTLTAVATDNGGATTTSNPVAITVYSSSPNRPPVLAAIGNKSLAEHTLLSFTASATDPDVPANTLTFSLDNAPAGATINPATGAFSWTPSQGQGPGSHTFSVRVTDNGSPARSAQETITVTVGTAPDLVVSAASTQTTTIRQGRRLSLSNTVTNQGNIRASGEIGHSTAGRLAAGLVKQPERGGGQ